MDELLIITCLWFILFSLSSIIVTFEDPIIAPFGKNKTRVSMWGIWRKKQCYYFASSGINYTVTNEQSKPFRLHHLRNMVSS